MAPKDFESLCECGRIVIKLGDDAVREKIRLAGVDPLHRVASQCLRYNRPVMAAGPEHAHQHKHQEDKGERHGSPDGEAIAELTLGSPRVSAPHLDGRAISHFDVGSRCEPRRHEPRNSLERTASFSQIDSTSTARCDVVYHAYIRGTRYLYIYTSIHLFINTS